MSTEELIKLAHAYARELLRSGETAHALEHALAMAWLDGYKDALKRQASQT